MLLEARRPFDLEKSIGLPPNAVIYEGNRTEIDVGLPDTDEFRTRLVLNNGPEKYDLKFLAYLFNLSRAIDEKINENARFYPHIDDSVPDGEFRELVRLHSPEKMGHIQKNFIRSLRIAKYGMEDQGSEVVMAFPKWGSLAIMRAMEFEGLSGDGLIPADISGSVGTETGHAKASNLPNELLDQEKVVFFPDDIFDTCVTLIQLGIERAKVKALHNGIKINHDIFNNVKEFEAK